MNFEESSKFKKEFKRLLKKYPSLEDDVETFRNVVSVEPLGNSKHSHVITKTDAVVIIKGRLFCRYLKGSSLRTVYAYSQEMQLVEFIELYSKGSKDNYDHDRVEAFLSE